MDENNLKADMSDALTFGELKSFITADNDELVRMKDIPNHGNLKEVKEHGILNIIMTAYNCRMKPNLLEGRQPHTAKNLVIFADDVDNECGTNRVDISTVRLRDDDQVFPSELLGYHMWRVNAVRLFNENKQ